MTSGSLFIRPRSASSRQTRGSDLPGYDTFFFRPAALRLVWAERTSWWACSVCEVRETPTDRSHLDVDLRLTSAINPVVTMHWARPRQVPIFRLGLGRCQKRPWPNENEPRRARKFGAADWTRTRDTWNHKTGIEIIWARPHGPLRAGREGHATDFQTNCGELEWPSEDSTLFR